MDVILKTCEKCKTPMSLSEFPKNKQTKDGLNSWCKGCHNERIKEYHKNCPWKRVFTNIKQRCNNKNDKRYHRYGGRGIQCLITTDELKKLWFRDKAWLLERPSIDREDNDEHYTYDNCRLIELGENSAKDKRQPLFQYSLDGIFIREWVSATEAGNKLKINRGNISNCCRGGRKTAGGFVWRVYYETMCNNWGGKFYTKWH